jgi:hypothetical protein
MTGRRVDVGVDVAGLLTLALTGQFTSITPTTGPSSLRRCS